MSKYAMHTHPTYTHKYLYKNITAHKTQRVREKHTEIRHNLHIYTCTPLYLHMHTQKHTHIQIYKWPTIIKERKNVSINDIIQRIGKH